MNDRLPMIQPIPLTTLCNELCLNLKCSYNAIANRQTDPAMLKPLRDPWCGYTKFLVKVTLCLLAIVTTPAHAELTTYPAGIRFEAGCTPDGACWPEFTTTETMYVTEAPPDVLRRGEWARCRCDNNLIIWISDPLPEAAGDRWKIIAHEAGHRYGLTRHKNGSVWAPKSR